MKCTHKRNVEARSRNHCYNAKAIGSSLILTYQLMHFYT